MQISKKKKSDILDNIRKRIIHFADTEAGGRALFMEHTGIKKGVFDPKDIDRAVGSDKISKILDSYPDLNAEWLLTGGGDMMKNHMLEPANDIENDLGIYDTDKFSDDALRRISMRIAVLYRTKGLAPHEFAEKINCDHQKFLDIVTGKIPIPASLLNDILEVFPDVNPSWLLNNHGLPIKEGVAQVLEPSEKYINEDFKSIPIIDIEAAAGIQGVCNPDYIEVLGYLTLPVNSLQKRTGIYYAIRNRGHSMSPTIYDKDYLIVRWLDRGEWQELRDEYIYVVVADGNTYVKRIKDRLNRGFMVCMSDNLDKSNYPNFTLEAEEIDNLFYTELKISPHLPNVNATYYDRVKSLEDKVDELAAWRRSLSK